MAAIITFPRTVHSGQPQLAVGAWTVRPKDEDDPEEIGNLNGEDGIFKKIPSPMEVD